MFQLKIFWNTMIPTVSKSYLSSDFETPGLSLAALHEKCAVMPSVPYYHKLPKAKFQLFCVSLETIKGKDGGTYLILRRVKSQRLTFVWDKLPNRYYTSTKLSLGYPQETSLISNENYK